MFSVSRRVFAGAASTIVVMGLTAGSASAVVYGKGEAGNLATASPGTVATLSSGTLTESVSYKCGPTVPPSTNYSYLGVDVTQGNGGFSAPHIDDAISASALLCDGLRHIYTFTMAGASDFQIGKAYAVATISVCGKFADGAQIVCTPYTTRRSSIEIVAP